MRFFILVFLFAFTSMQAQVKDYSERVRLWNTFTSQHLPSNAGGESTNWFSLSEVEAAAGGLIITDSVDDRRHPYLAYGARKIIARKLDCVSPTSDLKMEEKNLEEPEIRWVMHTAAGPFNIDSLGKYSAFTAKSWMKYNPHLLYRGIPSYPVRFFVPEVELLIIDSLLAKSKHSPVKIQTIISQSYRIKVTSGQTLSGIAAREKVTVAELKRWNNLRNDNIYIGQQLTIFRAVAQVQEVKSPDNPERETFKYVVREGDSLWEIAKQYKGVEVEDLILINNLSNDVINPGDVIRIPVQ
jgi:LysM repeat protein